MATPTGGTAPHSAIELDASQQWEMARIVAGEAPVSLMGRDAAIAVAWTVRNRLADGTGFWKMAKAYTGRRQPTDAEIGIVDMVLAADAGDDPTSGAKWAMSKQDRDAWGFREGDLVYETPGNAKYQIHVYQHSPFE